MADVAWVTPAQLADHLGAVAADDPRLPAIAAAADAFCKRKRRDLARDAAAPGDVELAALLYAAHLFRRRKDTFDELGAYEASESMTEVYRLLGRRPVAR